MGKFIGGLVVGVVAVVGFGAYLAAKEAKVKESTEEKPDSEKPE